MALDLGKQVGPLPLGAWIAVVGGGLGLAYYSYSHSAPAASTEDSQAVADGNAVGDGSVGGWQSTQPTPTDTTPVVETNEAWGRAAIQWLIAQGYDASESDSAIRKYLAANDPAPSIKEYMLQGLALAHFGPPPNALPPSLVDPPVIPPVEAPPKTTLPPPTPPAPSPPPAPASVRWDTIQPWPAKKSTLWGMAEVYYGNGAEYQRIYNANRQGVRRPDGSVGMISNPNLVHAGWRIVIP